MSNDKVSLKIIKKIVFLTSIILFKITNLQAQAITEDAETIYQTKIQLETAAMIEKYTLNNVDDIHWTFPTLLLRYGLRPNIELRMATALEGRKHIHRIETGKLGNVEIGFKLHLINTKTTHLSAIHHLILSTDSKKFNNNEVNAVTSLIFSQDFGPKFQIGSAIQYVFEDAAEKNLNCSLVLYYNVSKDWMIHIESYGELLGSDYITNLDIGVDWQIAPNLQWQIALGTNLKQIYHFASTGMVWQIN